MPEDQPIIAVAQRANPLQYDSRLPTTWQASPILDRFPLPQGSTTPCTLDAGQIELFKQAANARLNILRAARAVYLNSCVLLYLALNTFVQIMSFNSQDSYSSYHESYAPALYFFLGFIVFFAFGRFITRLMAWAVFVSIGLLLTLCGLLTFLFNEIRESNAIFMLLLLASIPLASIVICIRAIFARAKLKKLPAWPIQLLLLCKH